ncbi:MAG: ABC transporter substrate-binding protein [Anaerolineae bacterium]
MITRPIRLLPIILVLLLVAVTACQTAAPAETPTEPTAEPAVTEPTEVPVSEEPTSVPEAEAETETEAEAEPVLVVLGQPFTQAELEALEQVTATEGDRTASGVSLLAVLEAAGVDATDIALVASDGYAANVTVADLTEDAVLGYSDTGTLDALLPGLPKNTWVRDVVEIREGKPVEPAEPEDEASAGEVIPLDEPLELIDAAGRTVVLEALPQRILVVGRGPHMSLHVLYMFEEGRERLVGSESRAATPSNFLPVVDPAFNDIAILDANPNVEQIVAMSPDLVIMKGVIEDSIATALSEVDIPVLYVDLETVDAFFNDLANIGTVLGNPDRAAEIADYYRTRLDRLDAELADLAEEDKPNVLLVSYSDRGSEIAVQVPAAGWMQTISVERAGGHPVWLDAAAPTDGWTVTNFEQIAAWDPEMIFVVVSHNMEPQEIIDQLKADANYWSTLTAVQNGTFYGYPRDIFGWDQPEPRWILGMQWLSTKIHPELFSDTDMDAEVRSYFGELYGMDEAAIEEHIYPVLLMDVE